MVSLKWCKQQKSGIKLIEPNENLAKEYLKNAEETFDSLKYSKKDSNLWKATKKYYCEYFLIYAFLIRVGIKCEIHDCTIGLIKILEKEKILPEGSHLRLKKDKELRIDNQYYLKDKKVETNFKELLNFLLEIKSRILSVTLDEINKIRGLIKNEC